MDPRPHWLIDNPRLLVLAVALILIAGLAAWTSLPRIEDPRITTRNATVITPLPGANAERVEALVTKKLEDALREVAEVKTIESTSRRGISLIALELDDGVDSRSNQRLFSELRDQLAEAERLLPPEAGRPVLDERRGAVAYSLVAAITWDGAGEPAMAVIERLSRELADRLRALPGTEQVVRFGAVEEEVRVEVDPAELAALGLGAAELARRLAGSDPKLPAGALRTGERQVRLEVEGELDAAARVAAVPVAAGDGTLVAVGDLTRVERGWRDPPAELAFANGRRAILVAARTREAVHLDDWAGRARALVETFAEQTGGGVGVELVFDQSRYTNERLGALGGNLAAGAALVVLVVLVFLGARAALVVGAALPLSAALTLFGMELAGQQIHQMSIFGMIVAIGLLIDNAIVMTDEVRTRRAAGLGPGAAARAAVGHLAAPLAASTFTTILGFLPIFLLPGNVGDFVGPIAVAVILALLASFAVALTLIPALAALFVPPPGAGSWWREGVRTPRLTAAYRRGLTLALHRPVLAVLLCLVLPIAGFIAASGLGSQFFPPADRDQLEVQLWLAPDASIERTARTLLALDAEIRAEPGVRALTWVAGGSSPPVYYNQLRDQDDNPAYARATVTAEDAGTAKRLLAELQDRLPDRFPQARLVVRAFGQGPPIPAPVSLRLVGPDGERLRRQGEALRALLHRIPEVTESRASLQGGEPKLWLTASEDAARLAGLALADIAGQLEAALEGTTGGRVIEDLEDLPVRVRYGAEARADTARIATLPLVSPVAVGGWIPAEALGELELRPEVASITRRNGERVNTIEAWLRPGVLPIEVTRAAEAEIARAGWQPEPGYRLELGGDSAEQREALRLLLAYAPLLAALMLAALVLTFRSFRIAGQIGLVAVLSVGLGLLALWAGGYPLGFNPILGSAGLVGVAINASIVVLAAIRAEPRAAAGEVAAMVAAVHGATRHIVATTLTTVGGFLPLILLSGGDFWPPLAVVIAGGVALSIGLGLVLTPALYRLSLGRRQPASGPVPAAA